MTGAFLADKQHVIIMGPVGTGKTHLAQALGLLACQKNLKVCFIRTNDLLNKFHQAKADETWLKVFNQMSKYDVLLLDDFGLKALSPEQSSDLYDLIAAIHIKTNIIINIIHIRINIININMIRINIISTNTIRTINTRTAIIFINFSRRGWYN